MMREAAFLINSLAVGGAEMVVLTLLEKLKDSYSMDVFTLAADGGYGRVLEPIKVSSLSKRDGAENNIVKLLMLPLLAWRLRKKSREKQLKMVQSHMFRANYVNILSTFLGAKHRTQVVTHGVASQYKKKGVLGKINLILISNLYKKANVIIANSDGVKKDLQEILNFDKKIIVIHNPFDVGRIEQRSSEPISRTEFHFDTRKNYIICVGRLIKSKRQDDIIRAFSLISRRNADCELILLGDGKEKRALRLLAKQLELQDKVHFLGTVKNPFKFFSRCHFSVLASESESFGNVLVESMICKCPVISTDCQSGPREILSPCSRDDSPCLQPGKIEYGKYGILTPVGDIEVLARAMDELLSNTALRNDYAEKGYQRALDFDIEKILPQYERMLLDPS